MACTPTQAQLAQVASIKAARIKLQTGQLSAVIVDSNGERQEVFRPSLPDLKQLITELEFEYGIKTAQRPMGFVL